ncbi:unnamed protein product [Notodromas monacha]|uniref:Phytanoyl-CoA dioxygenase n=1 Tax=Notodromas monacha TaxID=399045 RepID=A0A7R9BNX1_9CRUS|nr:unnamed protein product [Notodromas monacha]CAG0918131.1 unnamed protein product [Notodromas monacha]
MVSFQPEDFVEKFRRDGMVVLQNFVTSDEVRELKSACAAILEKMDQDDVPKVSFSTINNKHHSEAYFIESGDRIRPFFEEGAFDPTTEKLRLPIGNSVNKVGHALHVLDPVFSNFTLGPRFQSLAIALKMTDPRIVQSMYIFKPPGIGGPVVPHRDETYLRTEPEEDSELVGVWLPLDSATEENGCLWFVPGSHAERSTRKFVRVLDGGTVSTVYEGEEDAVPSDEAWVPVPVEPAQLNYRLKNAEM